MSDVSDALSVPSPSPAAQGYQMPAEWAPHAATWLSWPHNTDTWPAQRLRVVEEILAHAVRALTQGEPVRINVKDDTQAAHVDALIGSTQPHPVHYDRIGTNDAWCRDHGATFVTGPAGATQGLAAIDWTYNGWGEKYPPYDKDADVARQMAAVLDVPRFATNLVAEGGALETNGAGVLLTTASCLLNPNRNPGRSETEVARVLREMLGVEQIVWLEGDLVGDDTDGHIDNLARFVSVDTVLAATEEDASDPNYDALAANWATLTETRVGGRPLTVKPLPMPDPVLAEGSRLPASYINFYIGNAVVLMPTFDQPTDDEARDVLSAAFPERKVVPLPAIDIVWGLGAFHCLTQQVPAV